MSRKIAAIAGFLGMLLGALYGSRYLADTGECARDLQRFGCELNRAYAPFLCSIAIGFLSGFTASLGLVRFWAWMKVAHAPRERRSPKRRVSEVEVAAAQLAAWGRAPGAKKPVVPPVPDRSRSGRGRSAVPVRPRLEDRDMSAD